MAASIPNELSQNMCILSAILDVISAFGNQNILRKSPLTSKNFSTDIHPSF